MTVPLAPTVYRYQGNGVTTIFSYPNRVLTAANLEVTILTRATDAIVETLTLTTDYTVTIVSNSQANVTVTNVAKIPSGTQDILVSLNLPASQTRSFPRADSLPAESIELGLDKLTLLAQKTNDTLLRSIRFPDSDTTTDGVLPPKAERALTYLAFDADGVPIASESAAGGAPAGAFGATLVATATQGAAQTLLDAVTPAATQTLTNKTLTSPVINGAILGTASPRSDCRLSLSGGNLSLARFNGNQLFINNTNVIIPSSPVTLAPAGSPASTTLYIYAYMVGVTVTLEWSTTAPANDATTGWRIKTGDATRTLVGMARTTAGSAWETSNLLTRSYFNRPTVQGTAALTADRTTTSTSEVEINSEIRVNFLVWDGEVPKAATRGFKGISLINATIRTGIAYNGAVSELSPNIGQAYAAGANMSAVAVASKRNLAEGTLHYATVTVSVNSGTGTWNGTGIPLTLEVVI